MKQSYFKTRVDPHPLTGSEAVDRRGTRMLRSTTTTAATTTTTVAVTNAATRKRHRTKLSTWTVTLLTAAGVATSSSSSFSFFTARSITAESTASTFLVQGEDTESHQLRAAAASYHQQKATTLRNERERQGQRHPELLSQHQQQQQQPGPPPSGVPVVRLLTMQKEKNEAFLRWCHESLGISSSLVEIDYFEYYDFVRAMDDRVDVFCEDCFDTDRFEDDYDMISSIDGIVNLDDDYDGPDQDALLSVTDYPTLSVRGLKAARDVEVGQVLISIPHRSLWTLSNVIDADPVLEPAMGRKARELHGWNNPVDEIPLLAVAFLYHVQKLSPDGDDSNSPHAPYLRLLLQDQLGMNIKESIPHLWDSNKLRHSATPAVRKVAKGIKKDVLDLYETIVLTLIEKHPQLFAEGDHQGHPSEDRFVHHEEDGARDDDDWNETSGQYRDDDNLVRRSNDVHEGAHSDGSGNTNRVDWMFSLERFHWAFALVNSRHWHLPIPGQVRGGEKPPSREETMEESGDFEQTSSADDHQSFSDQEGPPASTPTDEWLDYQRELQQKEDERESLLAETKDLRVHTTDESNEDEVWPSGNSFLAPVADLLNFGPPCTRGMYNQSTDTFEIIATCPFRKGQEITFWYTDACEDVFMANYGFTLPMMVPKCATEVDKAHQMRVELSNAYDELDRLDHELDHLLDVLHDCHCENQTVLAAGLSTPPSSTIKMDKNDNPGYQPSTFQSRQDSLRDHDGGGRRTSGRRKTGSKNRNRTRNDSSNDAKHAIRGGRRHAASSPKRVLRRIGNRGNRERGSVVQSRKSEF